MAKTLNKYICIHGHFYQPPRENPWLEAIEIQDSAKPFHDWNEKINAECYRPNCETRVLGDGGRIVEIVNNYEWISFNFGPTLMHWIEKNDAGTYEKIVEADRRSAQRLNGHGNAIAQCYNHTIMPLTSLRDKITQVKWGIADFERHFRRYPEGMWLPETAVDMECLDVLADHGIQFVILAPHQAHRFRTSEKEKWVETTGDIDPTRPYRCQLSGNNSISLFFYDGPISHDIAFDGLLNDGVRFAERLKGAIWEKRAWPQLIHIATDGESYGHHHRFGEMGLAKAMCELREDPELEVINYATYLERHPATAEAQIVEPSSWSCAHGVERWRDDCGCNSGGHPDWNQKWRKGLRETLVWLQGRIDPMYEQKIQELGADAWQLRNDYIRLYHSPNPFHREQFFKEHFERQMTHEEQINVLKLLEMERHTLLMFTSCAWFFDELSGIEPVQNMKYATRAIQLAKDFDLDLEDEFKKRLAKIKSNIPEYGDGARIYERMVSPTKASLHRVIAHAALTTVIHDRPLEHQTLYCFYLHLKEFKQVRDGRYALAVGRMTVRCELTMEAEETVFAVISLGGKDIQCAIRTFTDEGRYNQMRDRLFELFENKSAFEVIREIDRHFAEPPFTLKDLFLESLREFLIEITDEALEPFHGLYNQIFEQNAGLMQYLRQMEVPLPFGFVVAAESVLNQRMKDALKVFENENRLRTIDAILSDAQSWGIEVNLANFKIRLLKHLDRLFNELERKHSVKAASEIVRIVDWIQQRDVKIPIWPLQNRFFLLLEKQQHAFQEIAAKNNKKWASLRAELNEMGRALDFHESTLNQFAPPEPEAAAHEAG